jgi:methyl-accepting chemotaxis protein
MCAAIIGIIGIYELNAITVDTAKEQIKTAHELATQLLNERSENAERMSAQIAQNEVLIRAISELRSGGKRQPLIDAVTSIMKVSEAEFITITDETGKVLVRAHEINNFGDNIGSQKNVQMAMQGKQYTTIETGTAVKLSVRSGTPIYTSRGRHIGIVSLGYRLDNNDFVDYVKTLGKAEVTIFLGDTRLVTTVKNDKGERNTGTKAADNVSKTVLGGQSYTGKAPVAGKNHYTHYTPLRNSENNTIGMLFAGIDISNTTSRIKGNIIRMAAVMILLCAIALIIARTVSKQIASPIHELSEIGKALALGDLDVEMKVSANSASKDEALMLAAQFAQIIKVNREQASLIEEIAHGDISRNIIPKSDKDKLSYSIIHMLESAKEQISVMELMANNDLTADIALRSGNDSMNIAIKKMLGYLNFTLLEINEAVDNLKEVSCQISSGSQSLADGSHEQASSLEEVSSSLEETSSMTKQNAGNSNQAKLLTDQVVSDLAEADIAMKQMAEAIYQIKLSSDNTAKIIKTIDDIAFQTNLLALNAAVEAARAGEAGKGFAVVAEEVRNLAMRSAEAAKTTAALIEESVKRSEGGVKITEEVAKALYTSISHADKAGGLISEIAAACNDQALGIEQINTSIARINQVTQHNAANSQKYAGAAQELTNQAAELADMAGKFKLTSSVNHHSAPQKPLALPQHLKVAQIADRRGNN